MTIIVNCYDSGAQAGPISPYCNVNQNPNNVQAQPQAQQPQQHQESPGIGGIFNSLLEGLGMNKMFDGVKNFFGGKSGGPETGNLMDEALPEGLPEPMEPEIGGLLGDAGGSGLLEEGAELLPELALL